MSDGCEAGGDPGGGGSLDYSGDLAATLLPGLETSPSQGRSKVWWGRGRVSGINTATQGDDRIPQSQDTMHRLATTGQTPSTHSPITEFGPPGGQRLRRGGLALGSENPYPRPRSKNVRSSHSNVASRAGILLTRMVTRPRDGWVGVCKGYGASYASTPPIVRAATPPDARLSKRATVYARNKVHSSIHSLGYAVMRRFIAPTQAYGSPALGGGAAGALIVPSEAIDDRNAGIVLALSAISALSVYRRSHRENLQ